jgi:hypothetical protein
MGLEKNNSLEKGNKVTITDDLVEIGGTYFIQSDLDAYRSTIESAKHEYETTRQEAWSKYKKTGDAEKFIATTDQAIKSKTEKEHSAANDLISKGIKSEDFLINE